MQDFALEGVTSPSLLPLLSLTIPLRSRAAPLNQLWVWGSAVNSPSGVRVGAPAENEFGAL